MGLGPLAFEAHAAPVAEVVIPAETSRLPRTALFSAGPTGFLRHEPGRGHLWTTYAGTDTVVDSSAGEVWGMPEFGAGSDVVARYDGGSRTVTLRDMAAAGAVTKIALPDGHTYRGTLGRTVVTTASSGGWSWHLLDLRDDGTVRDRTVTGVPEGISSVSEGDSPVGDAHGMVVQHWFGSTRKSAWLDVDAGRMAELPYDPTVTTTGRVVLTATGAAWTGYKKIVGAGDLNGDGHGDLLAQDRSNELWRYDGTATGRFKARVKVFNDWGSTYNTVLGTDDITGDGKPDLVSRDTSGAVWRNNGDGKGSFGPRTRIATGWQGYKGLF